MMNRINNVLTYRGFLGSVHFSSEDNVFFGKVEGINDLITFEGETVQELTNAFRYVIDEHINDCENERISVKDGYKERFNVRLTPNLHREMAMSVDV
ncbi:hypothetical protein AGMMS4957_07090 [Bacteroidia bacterium]|nr:hypothetical protein AGMMS4957_07090 [Bacteroidia bacterium]